MGGGGIAAQRERDMRDDSFKNRDRAFIERLKINFNQICNQVSYFIYLFVYFFIGFFSDFEVKV